jgi:GDPmannose 4,6-dehydratase
MAFATLNLDWKEHVEFDSNLLRPTDLTVATANPRKAKEKLSWSAKYQMQEVVKKIVDAEKRAKRAES